MVLVWLITLHSMNMNVRIFAKHCPGLENEKSDWLSRGKLELFKQKYGHLHDDLLGTIPDQVWPIKKLWVHKFVLIFIPYFVGKKHRKYLPNSRSSSSQSSKISTSHIEFIIEKLKMQQHRSSTAHNYYTIWRAFNGFLFKLDRIPHFGEDRVSLYCTYLVDAGAQSQTIKSYISAIKAILKSDNYKWVEERGLLHTLTRTCKINNDSVRTHLPIHRGLMEMILFEIERQYSMQPYLSLMYKTLFALAYYGLLRVGELTRSSHTIKARDIHVGQNKEKILIYLYSFKTHNEGARLQKVKITGLSHQGQQLQREKAFFCPFKLTRDYMKLQENYVDNKEPFFLFRDKSSLLPKHMRSTLKRMLHNLNIEETLYDTHSMHIGRSLDLTKFGYTIEQVKLIGRWKSNAVYKYIRL